MIETHEVPKLSGSRRLQEYATGIFKNLVSRSAVKKAIKKGLIFVNSEKGQTADWIRGGETIELYKYRDEKRPKADLKLKVLYEDPYLAIIHKPAGVLVSGNKRLTVSNALSSNLSKSSQPDALLHPEPIHRLDFPTTGALLVGKTAGIVPKLNTLFEHRNILKAYLAITTGKMEVRGTIETSIDGKSACSQFEKLASVPSETYVALNLVLLHPQTGRRHQLRKHLAGLGNPIFGDKLYASPKIAPKGRPLYLHALSLRFRHPVTDEQIVVTSPPPKHFKKLFAHAINA